jgi:L-ribulose-5-phosphate 4-epimerase
VSSTPSNFARLQREAWEANQALNDAGLVVATFGNASVLDRASGLFAIKPSGVAYAELLAEDMVIVDLEGRVVHGERRPSSDTPTHAVLYREFDGLSGIAHTHSTHAVAWAQALRPIPVYGTTHADHLTVPVPCTALMSDNRIEGDYEIETGNQIVQHFRDQGIDPSEVEMVLVGGHGPFTWGTSGKKAVYNSVILEEVARMALLTEQINPNAAPIEDSLIDKHWQRKHGKNAYYGQ